MRGELALFGIKVVVIEPGFIITEFLEVANEMARPIIESDSPYRPLFEGFNAGYKRMRRMAGQPEDIAKLIVKAMADKNPRPRYAAPRHARIFLAAKKWMPDRLFEYIVNKQTGISADRLNAQDVK
jgi:NAD(P)-dependent dehydrogenase (short-subunit alcohol dehydrogenase family)